jgi:hypothetical protein
MLLSAEKNIINATKDREISRIIDALQTGVYSINEIQVEFEKSLKPSARTMANTL